MRRYAVIHDTRMVNRMVTGIRYDGTLALLNTEYTYIEISEAVSWMGAGEDGTG